MTARGEGRRAPDSPRPTCAIKTKPIIPHDSLLRATRQLIDRGSKGSGGDSLSQMTLLRQAGLTPGEFLKILP